jgi:alcohol dehydrogenase (cytochrome c)
VVSRGVSFGNGKVFVGRLDGRLAALDAKTGEEVWNVKVVDYKEGAVITSPPLVVKNLVITGFGGGEYGVRGNLTAYDSATGNQVWRTWLTPGEGEPGNETWKGDSWKNGGSVAWLIGSYDPKTNTVLYGTSNPSPWNNAVRGPDSSDYGNFTNLYSSSTVAFDADTGKIKWYLQGTPHDAWDYDGVNEAVLVDLQLAQGKREVMLKADRNGFFYVADRQTGKLISAKTYVPTNWATGIDPATARPIEVADKRPRRGHKAEDICPNLLGGKNWQPMSFNPQTGLVYIPTNNVCMDMGSAEVTYRKGAMYLGKEFPAKPGPGGYLGELVAWDPVKQTKVWGVKEAVQRRDARNRRRPGVRRQHRRDVPRLRRQEWHRALGDEPRHRYRCRADDLQHWRQAVRRRVAGRTASIQAFIGDLGKTMLTTPEGGALFVFTL